MYTVRMCKVLASTDGTVATVMALVLVNVLLAPSCSLSTQPSQSSSLPDTYDVGTLNTNLQNDLRISFKLTTAAASAAAAAAAVYPSDPLLTRQSGRCIRRG